jgi:hypothetical protein
LRDVVPDDELSITMRPFTMAMFFDDAAEFGSTAADSVVALALRPALGLGEVAAFPPQPTAPARPMMINRLDALT